ncbi:polysaccharide deacetylase family protein [Synechococcus sp. CBW1002]|uniref:polysaccharide deacetylase family protein n=2 Tax=unclassified Synechococcus TaxID=2626047 RepID=UPI0018CE93C1|nr:polysaccharide deacetylase family protein [Synechococcus sp. CBW1002]QPN59319.1 polysaccharide deacetylase family protein [Synechococcus sp. CBW1002]
MTPDPLAVDLRGYGGAPPDPSWPGGARVAVSLVMNLEAGAELSLAYGDETNESLYDIVEPVAGAPNPALSSHFGYESRAGYWRIVRLLERFGVSCTVSAAGRTMDRAPWLGRDAAGRGYEVAAHGYRWERHAGMAVEREREVIAAAVEAIERACGTRPLGWHTKGAASPHTRQLLVEDFGFAYDSDAYDDDLPYLVSVAGREHVVLPYAFDTNDMRFMAGGTFVQGDDFASYCIAAYDWLAREGEHHPTMLSVGIHPRLIGRPGRIAGLERFLNHVAGTGSAWMARRIDIARHWRQRFGSGSPAPANTPQPGSL